LGKAVVPGVQNSPCHVVVGPTLRSHKPTQTAQDVLEELLVLDNKSLDILQNADVRKVVPNVLKNMVYDHASLVRGTLVAAHVRKRLARKPSSVDGALRS
jgi:hypothetical protein